MKTNNIPDPETEVASKPQPAELSAPVEKMSKMALDAKEQGNVALKVLQLVFC